MWKDSESERCSKRECEMRNKNNRGPSWRWNWSRRAWRGVAIDDTSWGKKKKKKLVLFLFALDI